jgi:hypothetical protein
MDDTDRTKWQTDDTEDVEAVKQAHPPAIAGGNVPGTEATSSGMGTLAGGIIGSIAARDIIDRELPEEERASTNPDMPDELGDTYRETGDEGVSRSQKEAEADELND